MDHCQNTSLLPLLKLPIANWTCMTWKCHHLKGNFQYNTLMTTSCYVLVISEGCRTFSPSWTRAQEQELEQEQEGGHCWIPWTVHTTLEFVWILLISLESLVIVGQGFCTILASAVHWALTGLWEASWECVMKPRAYRVKGRGRLPVRIPWLTEWFHQWAIEDGP